MENFGCNVVARAYCWVCRHMPRNYPQGDCMNSNQSSSEQFMLYLKSLGGSEADVTGPGCVLSDEDTVESVVSRIRREMYGPGNDLVDPSILQASAQVVISRRDQAARAASPEIHK